MRAVVRRLLKILAALTVFGILLFVAVFTYLRFERSTEVELPLPTGSFAVGRVIYDWRDDGAVDTLAPHAGTKREVHH